MEEQDLPKHGNEKPKKILKEEDRRKLWRKEMEESEAWQNYFKQFNPAHVDNFIDTYLTYKNMWLEYGDMYEKRQEENSIRWVTAATKHLEIIQQKKLFDAQCLWRAEQLEIPEIKICCEFVVWGKNILNCKFIKPITQADIELYQQYLLTGEPDEDVGWWNTILWQYYEGIVESYHDSENSDDDFPSWYEYHNTYRGTSGYMSLPNIRGEKEDSYLSIATGQIKNETVTSIKNIETPVETKQYPYLSFYDQKNTDWLVDHFETKQIRRFYKAYKWGIKENDKEENLKYYLDILIDANEPIAMESNEDWEDAIKNTALKYRFTKIAAAMP